MKSYVLIAVVLVFAVVVVTALLIYFLYRKPRKQRK